MFAAGMSTWNSVEYADAMRGSCYAQLQCIDCHNPHRAIGPTWTATAAADDAVCLKCHAKLEPEADRRAHTHHAAGSAGSRCLNCHMPRINEGLQDVVRTHMIYSPTRPDMIEANHPNACNLCHTDRPIDWTLAHLKEWYGRTYDAGRIAASYGKPGAPVALGWLASREPAVRLVAADALTRQRDRRALPQLINALDDGYLVNRQFAAHGLEHLLNVRLADVGYRFYLGRASARDRSRRCEHGMRRSEYSGSLVGPACRAGPFDLRKRSRPAGGTYWGGIFAGGGAAGPIDWTVHRKRPPDASRGAGFPGAVAIPRWRLCLFLECGVSPPFFLLVFL